MKPSRAEASSALRQLGRERFEAYAAHRDPRVRDELVALHLPLARYLAAKFARRGESVEDLRQVAAIGLLMAVERFDVTQGVAFITFATPTIIGEIKRHFRDRACALKVPRRLQERRAAVMAARETLTADLGRSPTAEEVAKALELTAEDVVEALELGQAQTMVSLDGGYEGDDDRKGVGLLDMVGRDDLQLEGVENEVALTRAIALLSGRERQVVLLRFYHGLSQSETARRIGVSQMHVSRIQAKALQCLRLALDGAQDG